MVNPTDKLVIHDRHGSFLAQTNPDNLGKTLAFLHQRSRGKGTPYTVFSVNESGDLNPYEQ